MPILPGPVSMFDWIIAKHDWCAISALGLWLPSEFAFGDFGDLEHPFHGGQTVLLVQPLWHACLLFHELHYMDLSNWKLIGAFLYLLLLCSCSYNGIDVSSAFAVSNYTDYHIVVWYSMTSWTPSLKLLMLASFVSTLEDIMNNHSWSCRHIHSSNICNLP